MMGLVGNCNIKEVVDRQQKDSKVTDIKFDEKMYELLSKCYELSTESNFRQYSLYTWSAINLL